MLFSHFLRGIPGKKYCWAAKGEAALKLLAFFTPSPLFATFVLLRVSGHRAYTTRLTTKNPDGLGHFFSSNCILHFYGVFLPYFLSNKSIKYIEQIVRGLGVLSNRFTPSALSRFLGTSSSLGKKTSTKEGVKRASLKNRQWQWGSRKVHFSSGKWSEGITVMTLSRDHFAGRRFYENV